MTKVSVLLGLRLGSHVRLLTGAWTPSSSLFLQAQRSNNNGQDSQCFFVSFYCSGLDTLLFLQAQRSNNNVKTVTAFFFSFYYSGLDTLLSASPTFKQQGKNSQCIFLLFLLLGLGHTPSFCKPSVQTTMVKTVNAFLSLSFAWAWTSSSFCKPNVQTTR